MEEWQHYSPAWMTSEIGYYNPGRPDQMRHLSP